MNHIYNLTPLIYLASPYTHVDKKVMNLRAKQITECAIKLLQNNVFTFCPIAYNAPWSRTKYKLPHEWTFWEKFDKTFICRCDGLVVVTLEGWENSIGIKAEVEFAKILKMPVGFISYEEIMESKLDTVRQVEEKINNRKMKELKRSKK